MRRAVAVVGSGFGGLAAAIRLAAAGVRTVLFEARDRPGGRAYVYEDAGYTFDAGPTVITAPETLEELFTIAGERLADHVEMLPVEAVLPVALVGRHQLRLRGRSGQHARGRSPRWRPTTSPATRGSWTTAAASSRRGTRGWSSTPFLRFADMVRVAPALMRLRADRSVYGAVSRFVRHPKLREALSFHALLIGGNPFETSAIYTMIPFLERKWGVFFPRGGTGALVTALAALFRRLGGELRLSAPGRAHRRRRRRAAGHPPRSRSRARPRPRRSTPSSRTPTSTTPTRASIAARPAPPGPRPAWNAWTGRCRCS